MKKDRILVWGNGDTLKKNIYWLKQLYFIVGITDSSIKSSAPSDNLYPIEKALKLEYDFILIVSIYYQEIKESLIFQYGVENQKIRFFEDEFLEERKVSFGNKNKDVTFYILRAHWQESKNGFFNFFDRAMVVYYHTQKKGYELLVDMKNYYTEYAGLDHYGVDNVWEYYFEQPSQYSLDDAYQSANVILSRFMDEAYNDIDVSEKAHESLEWWIETSQILAKRFETWVSPARKLQNRLEKEMKTLIGTVGEGKILGVLARGTDYVYLKPSKHFIPCNTEEFIKYTKIYMNRFGYQAIYLATEDEGILEQFTKAFSDKELFFSDQVRIKNADKVLMDIRFDRENDGFLRGMEYCLIILMLSKCDGLLANCFCGGTEGAILLNGGEYSEIKVMDSGIF